MGRRVKSDWDNQTAIAFSLVEKKLNILLKDILSKRRWTLMGTYESEEECFANITIGKANLLIIDDAVQAPASFILREQQFHVLPILTPTIIICSDHNKIDMDCMLSMGAPVIVRKPLTPQKFLEAFDILIKRWNEEPLKSLRTVSTLLTTDKKQQGIKMLAQQVQNRGAHHLASTALSLQYRDVEDLIMTEKILISAFDQGIRSMNIILPLIDLYLYGSCPRKAIELIQKANAEYGKPNFLCIDAIQAHLMLNEIRECIPYLRQMINNNYYANVARHYLPRMLYSSGMLEEFDKSIRFRPDKFDEYQRSWHMLSDRDAKRRLSQYEHISVSKKLKEKEERLKISKMNKDKRQEEMTLDQSQYMEVGKPLFRKTS